MRLFGCNTLLFLFGKVANFATSKEKSDVPYADILHLINISSIVVATHEDGGETVGVAECEDILDEPVAVGGDRSDGERYGYAGDDVGKGKVQLFFHTT